MTNHPSFKTTVLLVVLLVFLAGCAGRPAGSATLAPQATRDPNLEKTFEDQLAAMNSAAVPVYREATSVLDAGDLQTARSLYEQVLELAPGFSTAYRRLGYIESSTGNPEKALELTRTAVELDPNGYNQLALAELIYAQGTPQAYQEAYTLVSEAVKQIPDDAEALALLVVSAAMTLHEDVAREANLRLLEVAPANPLAHYFAGIFAAGDKKWEKAESELLYAQQLGMPAEAVQETLASGIATYALLFRSLRWSLIAVLAWLAGLGGLYLSGSLLSRATLQAIGKSQASLNTQPSPAELKMRAIYRSVVALLTVYFYFSMPFVILTLFLVVGAAFYLFLSIGQIPIQFSLILVAMLFFSLIAILRSLFARNREIPPGRELRRTDAPEMWKLVEDIAHRLEIRPVEQIYINPGTGIGVYEKGGLLRKMRGAGQRNLILGMGVVSGLTQGELAAILAHEYGHFSNRDTAGGSLAGQVHIFLNQIAQRLVAGRVAYFFNPVWLFVLAYQRIFLRVTQGASRLQEILADRYAAVAFGSANFIEGLRKVIRHSVAFPIQANHEIRASLEANRPILNLYDLPVEAALAGELEEQVAEAMNRPTSEYDSHPAPEERIRLVQALRLPDSPMHTNPAPALALFPNPEAIQREMTAEVTKNIPRKA